ncbi:MAG: Abi family protein, partial [Clostridium saudiense]|nr:Abi family protein [Clostridium saudiense]
IGVFCLTLTNVINYYSKFFMDSNDHYINGTSFDEISHIYYFDKEIKGIFFKAILEIEKKFKSMIAYYFSENHRENYSYLIANNFKDDNIIEVTQTIAGLSRIITKKAKEKSPNSIKHYMNQHNNVPLWVLINYMTLGETITFYKHMKDSEKNKIAKTFSGFLSENIEYQNIKLTYKHIISFLDNIREIRNIVAHGNKFLDYTCRKNTLYINELHSNYGILPNSSRQNIYNTFIVMQVFMSRNQFAITSNSLRSRMVQLKKKIKTVDHNLILNALGFPKDWQDYPKLPQD